MVSVVVFPRKRVLGSRAFGIVAREFVFLVGVYILIVTLKVGWTTENILLSVAWSGVLTWELVLFVTPIEM
jgi:hypothetical protein